MLRLPLAPQVLFSIVSAVSTVCAAPSARVVDFRYGIPTWHQPLGVPDDWHKAQANERGALLYDFGPGPYAQPTTTVEASAVGEPFALDRQEWLDSARLPVVRTRLTRDQDTIEITTLSLPPDAPTISNGGTEKWERLDGITGALGWAAPAGTASSEFRNVAWGITRPVRYRFRVTPGASKRVMLGFCESYKTTLFQRTSEMHVEGAAPLSVDLALNAERQQPQVFLFDATDLDGNGWIDIAVMAPQGQDPNTTLATIAVYAPKTALSRAELIAGSAAAADRAELRIACGTEMQRQAPRTDLIHARYAGSASPVLVIRTGRTLRVATDGVLHDERIPFVLTQPRPAKSVRTPTGWRLEFPPDTREVTAYVFSGAAGATEIAAARDLSFDAALARTRERWRKISIPHGRVTVADPAIQSIVESSVRTVYQARENINGRAQFNSSFSLYRGLWTGDADYLTELAAMLGDSAAARETLDTLFSFQNARGLIDEMPPQQLFRCTPIVLWCVERNARITDNWDFARAKWPQIQRAVQALRELRQQTLAQPSLPYSGLLPPGFNDGGILDITAEYSSVYWAITGLTSAARIARAIGRDAEATPIADLAAEFRASFDRLRQRDQRRDAHGNLYLPVRVGFKGPDPTPQLAQWAIVETSVVSTWLTLDEELSRGSFAMLAASERQGLPVSTGWLPDGIWAGFGALYAHFALMRGDDVKTADLLYAVANHASPRGTWVEEQSLVGAPLKLAGDQPHCWASALFVRLTASMLAYDRDDTLHLLAAVPPEWLHAGAINRLEGWNTAVGTVTLSLTVSADGQHATFHLKPLNRGAEKSRLLVHTSSLARAGFTPLPPSADALIDVPANQPFTLEFVRTKR